MVKMSKFEIFIRIDTRCIFYIYPTETDYFIFGIPTMRGVPMAFDIEKSQIGIWPQRQYQYDREPSHNWKWFLIGGIVGGLLILILIIWCTQRNIRHRKQRVNLQYLLNELDQNA